MVRRDDDGSSDRDASGGRTLAFRIIENGRQRDERIERDLIKIGTAPAADLQLEDEKVSHLHATIEVTAPGMITIRNLDGTSGTLVNGERVIETTLKPGDAIRVGTTRIIFHGIADTDDTNGIGVTLDGSRNRFLPNQPATPPPALGAAPHPTSAREQDDPDAREGIETRVTKVSRMPTHAGEACLVLLHPPGPELGKRFSLGTQAVVGRGEGTDIRIERSSISRRHARVFQRGDTWMLEDLKSTNGSYVNDEPISESRLRDGDYVKVGNTIFKFLAGHNIEASYHEEIYRLSIQDPLTGAFNRRYLDETLPRELERASRYRRALSLVAFEIDHFDQINEVHGDLSGDFVLRELIKRVRGRLRREDILARSGDEEFVIVLPDSDHATARSFADQLRDLAASEPLDFEGDAIAITVSIGVVTPDEADPNASQLLKIAGEHLLRAKRHGGNRVVTGGEWNRWKADPSFRSRIAPKSAVVALSLLGRDRMMSADGPAKIDRLEGLLYSNLLEHDLPDQLLAFGALSGGGKLLVGLTGRQALPRLRLLISETTQKTFDEDPDARFAASPVLLAGSDAKAFEEVVAALDDELAVIENGRYLPQPLAVTLRAVDNGTTSARPKLALELGETLLQWMALCAAAELVAANAGTKTIAALVRSLSSPVTMGRWKEVLSTGVKELLEIDSTHGRAWRACFEPRSIRSELFNWFNSLVELRNDYSHGVTASDEHLGRKLVDEMTPHLRQLLKRELHPLLALIPAELELVGFEGELQAYRMNRWIGPGVPTPVSRLSRRRMNPGLWLCDAIADRATSLEPFFVRDTCPKCGARELFLLARLDELELRNPATGHALKKPVDELPISAEAREVLIELCEGVVPSRRT